MRTRGLFEAMIGYLAVLVFGVCVGYQQTAPVGPPKPVPVDAATIEVSCACCCCDWEGSQEIDSIEWAEMGPPAPDCAEEGEP